jgi:hypothetical protein
MPIFLLVLVGKADVWLRRSGLLKHELSWSHFSEEATHRFLDYSSYELTEKVNSIKQNNMSVSEYTDLFRMSKKKTQTFQRVGLLNAM